MSESPQVQIYILTRNRPEYVIYCVESALAQTYPNFEVVVSDNSTNNETEKALESYSTANKFRYKRRGQSYNVFDHFNLCVSESSAEYVMFFHDDDTLAPEALHVMVPKLLQNPDVVAVSSNATFINTVGKRMKVFNKSLVADRIFPGPQELLSGFFQIPMAITPFSSYLFRKSCLANLTMRFSEGRKHADAGYLAKVARQGKVYWIAQELMNYRLHGKNDSGIFDIKALFSLCRFLKKVNFLPANTLSDFKVQNILVWQKHKIYGRTSSVQPLIENVLRKYAFFYLVKRPRLLIRFLLRSFRF